MRAQNVKFTQDLVFFGTERDMKTDSLRFNDKQFIHECKLDLIPSTTNAEIHEIDKCNSKFNGELPTLYLNLFAYQPILTVTSV